jgi:hypothetical protein
MGNRDKKVIVGTALKRSEYAYEYTDRDEGLWQTIRDGLAMPGSGSVPQVETVINDYSLRNSLWEGSERHSTVRKKFKKAASLASKLADELLTLDDDTFLHIDIQNNSSLLDKRDSMISDLRRLAKPLPKEGGGQLGDPNYAEFIRDLARLFKDLTGKKATVTTNHYDIDKRGPFFAIINAVFHIAGKTPKSQEALAKAIKRAISGT